MNFSRPARQSLAPSAALAAALLAASAGSAAGPAPGDDPLLVSSTYLGGNGDEWANAAAIGPDGALWIVASSSSTEIPDTAESPASTGDLDVAVVRLDPATRRVLSVAWLGGASEESVSSADVPTALAFDAAGNAYIAGYTYASDFPATASSLSPIADSNNAFVARVSPDGAGFVWTRVIGGVLDDVAQSLCFAPDGDPVVVGYTVSNDFPTVPSKPPAWIDPWSLFVTRLRADGSGIVFSSRVGGNGYEYGGAIASLPGGGYLVAGNSSSTDFATRDSVFGRGSAIGGPWAFLAEIDAEGAELRRSALLGWTDIRRVSVEAAGTILLAGTAYEGDPRIETPAHGNPGFELGQWVGDALLLRLDATTWDVLGGALFGGSGAEMGFAVSEGSDGMLWLTGTTSSADLPVPGAVRFRRTGYEQDTFAAAFDPADLSLSFATYLGGAGTEWQPCVAPDPAGGAWIVGSTASHDFPQKDAAHARASMTELFAARVLHGDAAARPGAPSPFAADVVDGPAVRLRWTGRGGGPDTCFVVERKELSDFERVAVAPAGSSEWTDTSALPDRGYTYLVQAVGAAGASPPTQAIRVLTPGSLDFRVERGRSRLGRKSERALFRLAGRVAPKTGGAALPDLPSTGIRIVLYTAIGQSVVLDAGPGDSRWRSSPRRRRFLGEDTRLDFHPATGAFDLRVRNFVLNAQPGESVAVRVEGGAHAATISTVWRSDGRSGLLTR